MTREPISVEDLISLCEEGNCGVYYKAEGVKGKTEVVSLEETPQEVYGAGYQRILNVGVLRGALEAGSVLLRMAGPVFSNRDDDYEEFPRSWEAAVADSRLKVCFKTADVRALAVAIEGGSNKEVLDGRERKSVAALIAVLAQLGPINISAPHKAAVVIAEGAARLGLWVPGEDTIVKFLKLAASAKP
jgi:hypothetical protein